MTEGNYYTDAEKVGHLESLLNNEYIRTERLSQKLAVLDAEIERLSCLATVRGANELAERNAELMSVVDAADKFMSYKSGVIFPDYSEQDWIVWNNLHMALEVSLATLKDNKP